MKSKSSHLKWWSRKYLAFLLVKHDKIFALIDKSSDFFPAFDCKTVYLLIMN